MIYRDEIIENKVKKIKSELESLKHEVKLKRDLSKSDSDEKRFYRKLSNSLDKSLICLNEFEDKNWINLKFKYWQNKNFIV